AHGAARPSEPWTTKSMSRVCACASTRRTVYVRVTGSDSGDGVVNFSLTYLSVSGRSSNCPNPGPPSRTRTRYGLSHSEDTTTRSTVGRGGRGDVREERVTLSRRLSDDEPERMLGLPYLSYRWPRRVGPSDHVLPEAA